MVMHNYYLSTIKRLLGASFVGWVQEKQDKYLKIIVKKQVLTVPFDQGKEITNQSYKKLIQDILQAYGYGEQIQESL